MLRGARLHQKRGQTVSLQEISPVLDHDHQPDRVEVRESPDLGGRTVIYECRDPDCNWWRAEWEDNRQGGLEEFDLGAA